MLQALQTSSLRQEIRHSATKCFAVMVAFVMSGIKSVGSNLCKDGIESIQSSEQSHLSGQIKHMAGPAPNHLISLKM